MSERESVAVGLETDWKIASGFASERDRYAPHSNTPEALIEVPTPYRP
jgi:hypothetical protein